MEVLSLLLADGRSPTAGRGACALGEALADGLTAAGVPALIAERLRTVALLEASVAVQAAAATDLEALEELAEQLPPCDASRAAGRAVLRVGRRWWPQDRLLAAYADATEHPCRPVAFGAVAAAAGLTPASIARLSLYEDVATVTGAAPRLLDVDPADAAAWLVEAAPAIEAATERAVALAS